MTTAAPRRWLVALVAAAVGAAAFGAGVAATRWRDARPGLGSVDVGFLRDMADHHDQAVQLALVELSNGEAPLLKGFAMDVVASQRYEIGLMEARLDDWGHGRGTLPRPAMRWMGMDTSVKEMPGMASQHEITEFAAARGRDADARFVRLMIRHHEGGIHMAEHAWRHAGTRAVRELAERIAKLQRVEVRDLARARQQLGLPA